MQECQSTDLRDDEKSDNVPNGNSIKHKRSTKVAFGEIYCIRKLFTKNPVKTFSTSFYVTSSNKTHRVTHFW